MPATMFMLDERMPFLDAALDPERAGRIMAARLAPDPDAGRICGVARARLVRYKAGRRCLVEYELIAQPPDERVGVAPRSVVALGKAHARRVDRRTLTLMRALRADGFGAACEDGIYVPQPIGEVPEFNMWLQRKVEGQPATASVASSEGPTVGRRLARALHKLHASAAAVDRVHTVGDELNILRQRVSLLGLAHPPLASRAMWLVDRSAALAAALPAPDPAVIHRDFHPDQALISEAALHLLDLDLCSRGDPALDVGNFLAHVSELAVRTRGRAEAFAAVEVAFLDEYATRAPLSVRAVEIYKTLSLARLVQISTVMPERRHTTEALLTLCERRLATDRPLAAARR